MYLKNKQVEVVRAYVLLVPTAESVGFFIPPCVRAVTMTTSTTLCYARMYATNIIPCAARGCNICGVQGILCTTMQPLTTGVLCVSVCNTFSAILCARYMFGDDFKKG